MKATRLVEERRLRIARDGRGVDVHAHAEGRREETAQDGSVLRSEPAPLLRTADGARRAWEETGETFRTRLAKRWPHGDDAEVTVDLFFRRTTETQRGAILRVELVTRVVAEVLSRDPASGATMRLVVPLHLDRPPSLRALVERTTVHARGRAARPDRRRVARIELDPTATAQLVARLARRQSKTVEPSTQRVTPGTAARFDGPRLLHFSWLTVDDGPDAHGMACVALDAGLTRFASRAFRIPWEGVRAALSRDDARGKLLLASRWDEVDVMAPSLILERTR